MVSDALSLDLMMAHGNEGAKRIKGEEEGGIIAQDGTCTMELCG